MSDKVVLRPLKIQDAEILAELADNINIWNNVRDFFPKPYTVSDARGFIEKMATQSPLTTFAVDYSGMFAGVVGVVPQQDVYRFSAEIGYWMGEPFWNKGIATQAVKLMAEYAFADLNLNRLFAGVFEFNVGSMKVLEKAGFVKEAVFADSVYKNGKFVNEHRYALLKSDRIV